MWSSTVFLAVLVSITSYVGAAVGPCRPVSTDETIDYRQFATENGGKWTFKKMPELTKETNLKRLYRWEIEPTKQPNTVKSTLFYKTIDCKSEILGSGSTTFTSRRPTASFDNDHPLKQFKFSFLKYVPGQYVYYYICSNTGKDLGTDYRYVATHGDNLTAAQEAEIQQIEDKFKFKGTLKTIDLSPCPDE